MGSRGFKRGGPKFVQLYHSMLSEWSRLGLSCGARALHVELIRRHTGTNNGQIYLPTREAAMALGVGRNTVGKYYQELVACGFIVETKAAHLGVEGKGRSAEWRLTHLAVNDRPPTCDYRNLKPRHEKRATPAQKASQGGGDAR